MPAARAAHFATPAGAATRTLAPVEPATFLELAVLRWGVGWRCGSPGPRLVFNRVNGRRPPTTSPSIEGTQETYTLAHEENVRFVSEAWQQVEQQLGGGPAGESGPRPVQYVERTPNPRLQNFVPIDLDEWWAQQFLARITNCS
ncbi:MAPK regulated corepressor interacting protein 2 isoform X3 [Pteropus vampyrus]|uniref:MAPK regulated corepressor interacting protein 2 isoform X3 n=1 Tax=Pteropus vampyrus TaxID=132908 RepID=A0A6P3R488_PTEVA|nr:MAPK regulated corepressor interacting protein 2 isoform X3 [Pteropus vampyrus]